MKSILSLALFGALLFAGCDSTAQEGTSSETQTALQLLADNSQGLVSHLPGQGVASTSSSAARKLDTSANSDSAGSGFDCSGQPWWAIYDGTSRSIQGVSYDPGIGPDGTSSTCSRMESHEHRETFDLDSTSRMRTVGTWSQLNGWTYQIAEGSATIDFRTGASFEIPHYRVTRARNMVPTDTLVETIVINKNCQVEFTAISNFGDGTHPVSIAPVSCGGKVVGRFSWDRVSSPVVTDMSGKTIAPLFHPPVSFPEDSLGLQAKIVGTRLDPGDTTAVILAIFSLKVLSEDTARSTDTIHFYASPGTVDYGPGLASSTLGHPGDTLTFHLSNSALNELRGDTLVNVAGAWGGFFKIAFGYMSQAQSKKFPLPKF